MADARGPRVPDEALGGTPDDPVLVTPALLRAWPLPQPGGSKYTRGEALVVGGARAAPGAVMLAGLAALRVGAGRLTLATAASVAPHVAVAIPESAVLGLPEDRLGSVTGVGAREVLEGDLGRSGALLLGPGLDDAEGAARLLVAVVGALPPDVPVLLDSYAATVLPDADDEVRDALAGRLLLTPNTGELARLVQRDGLADEDVAGACLDAAERYGAAVACNETVVHDGSVWRVTDGDAGLGTSGSGDVMAGAVTGLLSREVHPAQALVWGKHVHAAAGNSLAALHGRIGFLAGELPPELPRVLRTLGGD